MVDFGDALIDLTQSQNSVISWRTGATGVGDFSEFIRLRRFDTDEDHPETRQNYLNNHAYHYGSPDRMIIFAVTVTRDLATDLKLKNKRNTNNVFPPIYWKIVYKDDDGKNITVTGGGVLPRIRTDRGFNAQGEEIAYELFLRIIGEPVVTVDP